MMRANPVGSVSKHGRRIHVLSGAMALVCLVSALRAQERSGVVTVCEVLSAPNKYSGRIVDVKGIFFSGRHGLFLLDRRCGSGLSDTSASICVVGAGHLDAPPVSFITHQTPALRAIGTSQRILQELDSHFVGSARLEGQIFFPLPGQKGFCANNESAAMVVVKAIKEYSVSYAAGNARPKKGVPK